MAAASKRSNDPPKRPSQKSTMKLSYYLDQFQKLGYPKMVGLLLVSSILEAYLILHKKYHNPIFHILIVSFVLVYFLKPYLFSGSSEVYLRDFSCYRPPSFCRVPFSSFLEHLAMLDTFDRESVDFMAKVLKSSGQGQQTYLPPSLHFIPPRSYHEESIEEVRMVLFPVMEELLRKTDLSAQDVDILIVNCSGLCPFPSLASIVVNRFKMRDDVKSFNLSGMGCSASMMAVDMAQSLLKVHKDSNAVVLSTEILTTGWYSGNERNKLVLNCLFRMGSAAILLTNRKPARTTAKYRLVRTLRTQRAFDDKAYNSAIRDEDSRGLTGVTLTRDILQTAGEMLRSSITTLGLSTLPSSEKLKFAASVLTKKFISKSAEAYVPNFKRAIDHFCLPTSGRPVIKEIAKALKLGEKDVEAAMATLHRFGNQSSSSLWYELAYVEAKERVKRGDRVWQLGMGSGPKAAHVVWECIRPIVGEAQSGPWADCIDSYPMKLGR